MNKIKLWVLSHKLIAIILLGVLLVGIGCSVALPIALHEHSYSTEWASDETHHWHNADCRHEEEIADKEEHKYDNACDATCNVCGYTRTVGAHVYDNDCDTTCNVCNATRTVGNHVYDNDCDATCNECGATRTVGNHVYDNACDTTCNECGATRTIQHDYEDELTAGETTHWYECSVCQTKKDEEAHAFTVKDPSEKYLHQAATATSDASYYYSCECGAKGTETFTTDKISAELSALAIDDKVYDGLALANPTYTVTSDGAVTVQWYQGETLLTEAPKNAGSYTVKVKVAETEVYIAAEKEKEVVISPVSIANFEFKHDFNGQDTFEVLLDHEDYAAIVDGEQLKVKVIFETNTAGAALDNYELFALVGSDYVATNNYLIDEESDDVAINKKEVNVNAQFTYTGGKEFTGAVEGVVTGFEVDYKAVFEKADANSTLTSLELVGVNKDNYVLSTSSTASIVPIQLDLQTIGVDYNGGTEFKITLLEIDGIINDETVYTIAKFDSKNVGAQLIEELKVYNAGNNSISSNYVITNGTVIIETIGLTIHEGFEYNGTVTHTLNDLEKYGVVAGDEVIYTATFESKDNSPDNPVSSVLSGEDANNYYIKEDASMINAKVLTTNEASIIFSKTYDGEGNVNLSQEFTSTGALIGIPEGETLQVNMQLESGKADTYTEPTVSITNENFVLSDSIVFVGQVERKAITNIDLDLPYCANSFFRFKLNTTDCEGLISGDEVILVVEFDGADVGSNFKGISSKSGSHASNYIISDSSIANVTMSKYVITQEDIENYGVNELVTVYDGTGGRDAIVEFDFDPDYIDSDKIILAISNENNTVWEVGDTIDLVSAEADVGPGYELVSIIGGDGYLNYVLDKNLVFTLTINPATLTIPEIIYKTYDKSTKVSYQFTTEDGLIGSDTCTITFDSDVAHGIPTTESNYDYDENSIVLTNNNYTVTFPDTRSLIINKIQITNLDLYLAYTGAYANEFSMPLRHEKVIDEGVNIRIYRTSAFIEGSVYNLSVAGTAGSIKVGMSLAGNRYELVDTGTTCGKLTVKAFTDISFDSNGEFEIEVPAQTKTGYLFYKVTVPANTNFYVSTQNLSLLNVEVVKTGTYEKVDVNGVVSVGDSETSYYVMVKVLKAFTETNYIYGEILSSLKDPIMVNANGSESVSIQQGGVEYYFYITYFDKYATEIELQQTYFANAGYTYRILDDSDYSEISEAVYDRNRVSGVDDGSSFILALTFNTSGNLTVKRTN